MDTEGFFVFLYLFFRANYIELRGKSIILFDLLYFINVGGFKMYIINCHRFLKHRIRKLLINMVTFFFSVVIRQLNTDIQYINIHPKHMQISKRMRYLIRQ